VNTSCDFSHHDAAYVLGALSPEDRLAFERHLPGCASCRRAVQELAGMPGLLAQVSSEVVLSPPDDTPVPDTLLPRLDREVRRYQTRRSWLTMGVAAAVVVLITAFGAVAIAGLIDDDNPPAAGPMPSSSTSPTSSTPSSSSPASTSEPMEQLGQHVLNATVTMTSVAWGTKLDLTCTYDAPEHDYGDAPPAWSYALLVRGRDGAWEQVGSWTALPGKTMSFAGGTSTERIDITEVEVRAPDGTPVLRLTT
jgi:hypothetical protein